MLSRVANSLYWMSRYIERAENTARVLEVNLQLLGDFEASVEGEETGFWEAIVESAGDMEAFREAHSEVTSDRITEFLTFSPQNGNSILAAVNAARENARMIRDQISQEMWECINALYHFVQEEREAFKEEGIDYTFFQAVKNHSHRFLGLTEATYFHASGYKFLQVGKYLERADQTSRIVDLKYFLPLPDGHQAGGAVDLASWVAILRSCSAVDAFQSAYLGEVDQRKVAAFLILSQSFPRSVRFCVRELDLNLRSISGTGEGLFSNRAEKLSGRLMTEVAYTGVDDVLEEGLHEYIDRIQERLIELNQAIYEEYFALPPIDLEAEIALQQNQAQQQQQ